MKKSLLIAAITLLSFACKNVKTCDIKSNSLDLHKCRMLRTTSGVYVDCKEGKYGAITNFQETNCEMLE